MRGNRVQMKAVILMAMIALVFSQTALPTADPTPGFSVTPTATPPALSPSPTATPALPTPTVTPTPSAASSPAPSFSPTSSVAPASPSPTSSVAPSPSPSVTPPGPSASSAPPAASASSAPSATKTPVTPADTPQSSGKTTDGSTMYHYAEFSSVINLSTPSATKTPVTPADTPGSTGLLPSSDTPQSSGKTTDGSTMYHYAEFSSVINLSKFDSDYFNANFTTFGSGSYFEIFSSLDSSDSSMLSPLVSLFLLALSVLAFFL
eukprot:CAMPEP_0184369894 /NCGR_PEP_ID=MMETSP1089-20130417/162507_1 /TAXON_ID=38269 ORGANISM="Gloeochaete wittrockiana, Strain SAG46.84" /NCGR_SAMPLE_ID=MMETSP1089 /ASSEMBLY_ACC=CAM_ASM_000445 /LENGTH=262 /DNA_ID=CAMNT_0026712407 /DNA_START=201 /DNA_END=989 /DNA_ORIENTATION=+